MTSPLARLAEVMDARRLDLGLTWDEVSAESGVHRETIRAIRNRGTGSIRALTKRGLEKALQWRTGSIDAILSGGDPTPIGSARERPASRKSQAERFHDEEISAIRALAEETLERLRRIEEDRATPDDHEEEAG